jgi:hypothetical protein
MPTCAADHLGLPARLGASVGALDAPARGRPRPREVHRFWRGKRIGVEEREAAHHGR